MNDSHTTEAASSENEPLSSDPAELQEQVDALLNRAWIELRVNVPLEAGDALSGLLWELGAEGITEEPSARAGEPWVVLKAYVQTGEAQSLAEQVRAWLADADEIFPGASHGRVSTRIVEQQDWDAAWKEYFKPTRISQRIVIRPSWEPYTPETGDVVVDLDPGMAFGTGTHETTRGCLKAIDALFGSNDLAVKAFDRPVEVLDVGTGSGILLIAALLLGGTTGVGIDLDPIAVLASTENCARNQLQSRVRLSDTLLQHTPGTYPLVLANILAPTLIELAGELVARMTPDGVLVLSGLLVDQQTAVADAFHPFGLQLEAAYQEGEWATLVMRRGMA